MSHYPCKVAVLERGRSTKKPTTYWPVTSNRSDNIIVGDGILGGEGSPDNKPIMEFTARCCNIVYEYALDDMSKELEEILNPELLEKIKDKLLKRKF